MRPTVPMVSVEKCLSYGRACACDKLCFIVLLIHIDSRAGDGSQDFLPAREALYTSPIDSSVLVKPTRKRQRSLYVIGEGDKGGVSSILLLASPVIYHKAGSFTLHSVWVLVR